MKVTIIGAAGMIGRKLAERLLRDGQLNGSPLTGLHLVDVIEPRFNIQSALPLSCESADLSQADVAGSLMSRQPDVVFHLAAVVSGEAERDFRKGYRVNMDGTRHLLEAIRHEHERDGYCPRLVFASSIAVYGTPLPDLIDDTYHQTPLSSYGVQKRIGELLLADCHRRRFLNGVGLRLPTICIRPGKPNQAASSFFSGILREPINGQEAILPVPDDTRHWFASPCS